MPEEPPEFSKTISLMRRHAFDLCKVACEHGVEELASCDVAMVFMPSGEIKFMEGMEAVRQLRAVGMVGVRAILISSLEHRRDD